MRIGRRGLHVIVGVGLAMLGLAALGDWLSPPWEPRQLPSDLDYGSLPAAPEPKPSAGPANGRVRMEEVHIRVRDAVLGGTVISPVEGGRYPAVVLVHGAGQGHRTSLVELAEHFSRGGIVALAYDKRTVGYNAVTNRDFGLLAEDALSAVELLRPRDNVDPARIGLWGISEGGWVAPIAASRAPDEVAFVILVSAPVVSPKEQLAWGVATELGRLGAPAGLRSAAARALRLGGFNYVNHDPLPALEQTSRPVLAIYGTDDTAIPVVDSSRKLAAALERGSNRAYTIRFFTGADHELRVADGGFAPGYLETMVAWVEGLPATAQPPPGLQLGGGTPAQRYAASALPPPPWYATGAALALTFALAAVGLLASPIATLIACRHGSGERTGDAELWRSLWRSLRRLAVLAISTHLLFTLALGAGIALALTRTGSPLIVNGGWVVTRLSALATVVLMVAGVRTVVSTIRSGWRPTGVEVVSLVGTFSATGVLLLVAAYWGLFAFRW